MTRLFLRYTYITFLWIILMANLFMAFDMMGIVGSYVGEAAQTDFSNRYFGVGDLINCFKTIDSTNFGTFLTKVGGFYNDIYDYASKLFFQRDWPSFNDNKNFWDSIVDVFNIFANIGQMIASMFVYLFGMLIQIFYFILFILEFVFFIAYLLSGNRSSLMPYDWYGIRDSIFAIKCLIV